MRPEPPTANRRTRLVCSRWSSPLSPRRRRQLPRGRNPTSYGSCQTPLTAASSIRALQSGPRFTPTRALPTAAPTTLAHMPTSQCVPSRTSMMMGHTHHIGAWNNNMGLAHRLNPSFVGRKARNAFNRSDCERRQAINQASASEHNGKDRRGLPRCMEPHRLPPASRWQQNVNSSTPDVLVRCVIRGGRASSVRWTSASASSTSSPTRHKMASTVGAMSAQTRSADIRGPTKLIGDITSTEDGVVFPQDWQHIDMCVEWLDSHDPWRVAGCSTARSTSRIRFTNATWLTYVNKSAVSMPRSFTDVERMPADAYRGLEARLRQVQRGGNRADPHGVRGDVRRD